MPLTAESLTDGMGGDGMVSLGGTTDLFASPSAAPTTCHMRHGPDPPFLWQELTCPQAPENNRAPSPASFVSLHLRTVEAWVNSAVAKGALPFN